MMSDMVWIVGPCCMETESLYLETADKLCELMEGRNWYYKSSFDKANRTAVQGRRGPGLEDGLRFLQLARDKFPGIRLTTDVHETQQVEQQPPVHPDAQANVGIYIAAGVGFVVFVVYCFFFILSGGA